MSRDDYMTSLDSDSQAAIFRASIASTMLAGIAPAQADASMLDVGCGLGQLLLRLEEKGYTNLFGVDSSEQAITYLRTKAKIAQVQHLDVEDRGLPFVDDYFDFVFCMEVFEHLYDPASVLQEITSVLSPGGYGIFSFPNEYRLAQRIDFLKGRSISSPLRVGGHVKFFNYELVVKFISLHLRIENIHPVGNARVRRLPLH